MKGQIVDRLEQSVASLIAELESERSLRREFEIRLKDLEARLGKEPSSVEVLREENRRLRRNAELAAEKIEELMKRL